MLRLIFIALNLHTSARLLHPCFPGKWENTVRGGHLDF